MSVTDLRIYELMDEGVTVLTPGRRLAHSLMLGYASRMRSANRHVWRTPRVLPWVTWLRDQWLQHRAHSRSMATARLLSSAQSRVLWEGVIATSPIAQDLLSPMNAARTAQRSWERLQDYCISPERLARSTAPEARALHAWIRDFLDRCELLQAVDDARLEHWAWQISLTPDHPVTLYGFDVLVPAARRLVNAWREQQRIIDCASMRESTNEVVVVTAADADAELDRAARWARAQLESGRKHVGVVIADLETRRQDALRVFTDVFAPGGRSLDAGDQPAAFVIAAPQPLACYPMVDAALSCLQMALGGGNSTVAGRILRSPFLVASDTERDLRALADFRLRDEQRDRWDWLELERWCGLQGCVQLQLAALRLNAMLASELENAPASVWAERFHSMLQTLGWPGERPLSSVEHQTVLKMQSTLAELGTLDSLLGALTFAAALAQLRDILETTAFEPETPETALTLIDPTTVIGMRFDALWVTGFDATHQPPPAHPDPLIPLELQREAGIPESSAAGALEHASTRLNALVSSAPQVVLSWPERQGDEELQPSPLLKSFAQCPAEKLPDVQVRSFRRTLFEARPQLAELIDDHAPALDCAAARGGAGILELQSRCAFRAQAELRLHAKRMSHVGPGIEPRERGTLIHRVLAKLWSEIKDQQTLAGWSDTALEAHVRSIAARQAGLLFQSPTRHRARIAALAVESTVRQIMQLLALERARSAFNVRFAEQGARFAIGGLEITLQPDRMDELADGGSLIIDYKLGASHRPRQWLDVRPGRPRRPQLPLYALAQERGVTALAFAILSPGKVEYRGWSSDPGVASGVNVYPAAVRRRPTDPEDWPSLVQHWQTTLTQLAEQFVAGSAVVDPLPQECSTCHLMTLCRVHERVVDADAAEADGNGDA